MFPIHSRFRVSKDEQWANLPALAQKMQAVFQFPLWDSVCYAKKKADFTIVFGKFQGVVFFTHW